MSSTGLFTLSLRAFFLAAGVTALSRTSLDGASPKSEYFERLSKVPPLSAEAYVELGEWCRQGGLGDEALQCFQEALWIDTDCEAARAALGYKRYGTGWRKQGDVSASAPRATQPKAPAKDQGKAAGAALTSPNRPAAPRDKARPKAARGAAGADDPGVPAPSPEGGKTSSPPDPPAGEARSTESGSSPSKPESEAKPEGADGEASRPGPPARPAKDAAAEARVFEAEVEKKKSFAKEAAGKLQVTFNTVLDDHDFLVHSTLPKSSREVQVLLANLKSLKKVVSSVVGGGSSVKIWPDRVQVFLLKSEPEYERFAEMVDGIKSAKNSFGGYPLEGHTVVWNPESRVLAQTLGDSALKNLNGSSRFVGWWLEQGISELIFTQSSAGVKEKHYQSTMVYASDIIKSEGENLKIFNLIETAKASTKDSMRNKALAFSLVDFLFKKSRKGLQDVVEALKSDKAPIPPKSEQDFNAFYLSYISFQEESLKSAFHMAIPALGEKWKLYVAATADALKKAQEKEEAAAKEAAKDSSNKGKKGKTKG